MVRKADYIAQDFGRMVLKKLFFERVRSFCTWLFLVMIGDVVSKYVSRPPRR